MPGMATVKDGVYEESNTQFLWGGIENNRLPIKYLANLFTAGNADKIVEVLKRLMAVRWHRRQITVGDVEQEIVDKAMGEVSLEADTADAIFRLTSLATFDERFVIPPAHREESIEMLESTADVKGSAGFGFKEKPKRGW